MTKRNRQRGFTMAEMLIVVAIIGVLAAVSFVAVAQHQRSLERLERDSVAREIFVAAQNHLTMAQGQGYLGLTGDDIFGRADSEDGVYYFAVYQGDQFATPSLLGQMLPFGAIDETVRAGGSYIIRYHPQSATVMDVFYCSTVGRYAYNLQSADLSALLSGYREGRESARRNYNRAVLGWYGGAEADSLPRVTLQDPAIIVENGDKLRVGIVDNNAGGSLQLVVTGMTSGAKKVFMLKSTDSAAADLRIVSAPGEINGVECAFAVVLDDITTPDMHFADLATDNEFAFIPGEDITVQAIAFDNTQISNIGYSAEITVNSLYEKLDVDAESQSMTASVSSIRHLENLDRRISNVTDLREVADGAVTVDCSLVGAVQTSDLSWTRFKGNADGTSTVIQWYDKSAPASAADCYIPVVPTHALSYDGQYHSISEVKVDYPGDAGLFGAITGTGSGTTPTGIANLALIDFDITQAEGAADGTHAGALAGTLNNVSVTNVTAYNSKSGINTGVTAHTGSAGGLVGQTVGCEISRSAASICVTSDTGAAGGLMGETSGGSVSACYAGGHTDHGTYYQHNDDGTPKTDGDGKPIPVYNVTATAGNAGGLVGTAVSTPIDHSYATCSVTGQTAGGFVASASAAISDCYATGLVLGTGTDTVDGKAIPRDGAFAYSITSADNCHYFEIINERADDATGYACLTPLGNKGVNANITPLDASLVDDPALEGYNETFANPANWTGANAYDDKLVEYYNGKYNLPTVARLGAEGVNTAETTDPETGAPVPADFVAIHHGDWPAPEIFVLNDAG